MRLLANGYPENPVRKRPANILIVGDADGQHRLAKSTLAVDTDTRHAGRYTHDDRVAQHGALERVMLFCTRDVVGWKDWHAVKVAEPVGRHQHRLRRASVRGQCRRSLAATRLPAQSTIAFTTVTRARLAASVFQFSDRLLRRPRPLEVFQVAIGKPRRPLDMRLDRHDDKRDVAGACGPQQMRQLHIGDEVRREQIWREQHDAYAGATPAPRRCCGAKGHQS